MSNPNNPFSNPPVANPFVGGGSSAPSGDKLTAAQRARVRRLSAPKDIAPDEEAGELNIVPFLDIITNVMMFVLASITVSFTVTLDADAPKGGAHGVRANAQDQSLNLTLFILDKGYFLKGRNYSLKAGCTDPCTSSSCDPTVPRIGSDATSPAYDSNAPKDGLKGAFQNAEDQHVTSFDGLRYDPLSLTRCLRNLKSQLEKDAPELADEQQAMISANPGIPFQEVLRVMDALRKDETGECCPPGPAYDPSTKSCSAKPVVDNGEVKWTGPGCLYPKVVFTVAK